VRDVAGLAKRAWRATWTIALFVALWGALEAPLLIPFVDRLRLGDAASPARLYVEATSCATLLIAAWLMVRFVDKRPFVSLGFDRRHCVRDAATGLAIGATTMFATVALLWLFGWAIPQSASTVSIEALFAAGVMMLVNTMTQELLVRGYIQQTLQSQFGALAAVVISAAIFALLHFAALRGAPLAAFNVFAAGVLLGTAYAVTQNLWMPIALHFGWNFVQGPLLGLTVSGQTLDSGWTLFRLDGPPIATGGAFGPEGGLVTTVTTLAGIALLLKLRARFSAPTGAARMRRQEARTSAAAPPHRTST
jgi:membrane protease YdiL (CAAX protease family)